MPNTTFTVQINRGTAWRDYAGPFDERSMAADYAGHLDYIQQHHPDAAQHYRFRIVATDTATRAATPLGAAR